MNRQQYLKEYKNLPECLKDFHDQKDVFKTMWTWWGKDIESKLNITWMNGHCFIIDKFLWFMGLHGYKLQKDRSKDVDFLDLNESIEKDRIERSSLMKDIME